MPTEKILIVDDERLVRWSLRQKCEEWGYTVIEAESGEPGLKLAQRESPDLVLLDVRLPDASGIELLEQLKKSGDARAVIMITADPQLEDVKTALKLGAYDFVGKPLDFDELEVAVKNAIEATRLRSEVESLRGEMRRRTGYHNVIGVSQKMSELLGFVHKIASSEATTILVQGESGTGKDLIAKAIHYQSRRQEKPFVAINCSAIPETLMEAELFGHERGAFTDAKAMKKGLFEMADGGTLILDEIGDLSVELQTRLFRFVEERQLRRLGGIEPVRVDCRILCATNQDLAAKIKAGTFREELYYRLGVVTVKLPPLRERPEDIPHLASFFLERFSRRYGKSLAGSPRFYEALLRQRWPGNVRQLKNVMERLTALHPGGVLEPEDLAEDLPAGGPASQLSSLPWKEAREQYLASFELSYAQAVLARCDGNISAAAREAGVDRKTFYVLLKRDRDPQAGE